MCAPLACVVVKQDDVLFEVTFHLASLVLTLERRNLDRSKVKRERELFGYVSNVQTYRHTDILVLRPNQTAEFCIPPTSKFAV
jgi:hypothetical protein